MNDDIVRLETKLAFLEQTVSDLNEVTLRQQEAIDNQQKRLDTLIHMYREMKESIGPDDLPSRKPPHY